ncbi:uncharacterized protein TNCV_2169821 [Trichonephila clavipes]|nr:uncharacterized protein TNCV_2169821 [Trichonephila clavipes]
MIKVVLSLALFCAISHQFVDADDECNDQIKKFIVTFYEMNEDGDAPECYKELGLDQFRITAEDEDTEKELQRKLNAYVNKLPEEVQEEIKECTFQIGDIVKEKMGAELTEECKKDLRKFTMRLVGKN